MSKSKALMQLRNDIDMYIEWYAETGNPRYIKLAKELLQEIKLIKEEHNDNS